MKIALKNITNEDNLEDICAQMQPANWAMDNEMTSYRPHALKRFLADAKNILLLAYDDKKIVGAAIAYQMPHPDGEDHLYVHEIDTHPDYRRLGIATQIMKELIEMAKARGCAELWLGADDDNPAAQKLYESFNPDDIDKTFTYSYTLR